MKRRAFALLFLYLKDMSFSLVISILLGLGLSSAVGFRIFVPALITSVAGHYGYLQVADSMQWMVGYPAMITLGVATVIEIFGYYFPFVDNLLDTIAAPAAAVCGTLLMGSTIIELDPFIKWPISLIAGGGVAATVQSGTSTIRAASSGFTAGIGNPILSTLEAIVATILSVLSIVLPILAGVVVLWLVYKIVSMRRKKQST